MRTPKPDAPAAAPPARRQLALPLSELLAEQLADEASAVSQRPARYVLTILEAMTERERSRFYLRALTRRAALRSIPEPLREALAP